MLIVDPVVMRKERQLGDVASNWNKLTLSARLGLLWRTSGDACLNMFVEICLAKRRMLTCIK